MSRGIFITGTDTDVGKTVVTAGILAALREKGYNLGVMKPFQSGAIESSDKLLAPDLEFILERIDLEAEYELMNPIRLKASLAPSVAAEVEGVEINLSKVRDAYTKLLTEYDALVVEGAGGLMVPLAENFLIPDLVQMLDLPIIIVARPNLGTINHTVLTVKMARSLGLEVLGVIINGLKEEETGIAEETNPQIISQLAQVPILAIIPYIEDLEDADLAEVFNDKLDIERLIN